MEPKSTATNQPPCGQRTDLLIGSIKVAAYSVRDTSARKQEVCEASHSEQLLQLPGRQSQRDCRLT
jgi:hypothetical protein